MFLKSDARINLLLKECINCIDQFKHYDKTCVPKMNALALNIILHETLDRHERDKLPFYLFLWGKHVILIKVFTMCFP